MKVDLDNKISFKGYDVRPLKGFLMTYNCHGIAQEMSKIAQKEGFKLFAPLCVGGKYICREAFPRERQEPSGLWAQDLWMIVKDKLFAFEYSRTTEAIKEFFKLKYDFTEKIAHETEHIRQTNQNIWDLFAEMKRTPARRTRELSEVAREFEIKKKDLYTLQDQAHIKGGNIYVVKGDNGDEVIIGEDELKKFDIDEIQSMYCAKKVTVLPQMDFHLDLFIRPLDNKKVLLTDDKMTYEILKEGVGKLMNYIYKLPPEEKGKYKDTFVKMGTMAKCFADIVHSNTNSQTDEVAKIFEENGFEVIRVPGRVYETYKNSDNKICLKHICNYMNANVIENKDGKLVYITNKSNIDKELGLTKELSRKIGFSFENEFKNSISQYVQKGKVYFIKGNKNYMANELLSEYQGGIHCACMEVPKE